MEKALNQHHQPMIYQPTTTTTTTTIRRRRRKPSLPPLGLRNLGNTCYLNSVLQCLTYTPPLANFCLTSQHYSLCSSSSLSTTANCPFCILERRIARSLTFDSAPFDSPNKIHSCLTLFSDHFRYYRQEDAHEFLRYVIDACHNTCLKLNKIRGVTNGEETVVKGIFGGELRSQVKCVECGGESNKVDEIMDVSLDLFQISSVKEAFQRFFQTEVLNGNNKYKCDKCEKLVIAKKQMSILKAPNVLVIQLKRFEGIHGGKIDRPIAFEECLVLSNYMCKESQDPNPEYNLFGTIVHSGYSPESGHYYAYIKDTLGRWYRCNDSFVSLSTLQEVLSEKVYMLFFTRTNQRPQPTKSSSVTNGVKLPHCNGYDAKNPKEAVSLNSAATRPQGAQNSEKVISTTSKNGKVPLGPRIKFGNFSKDLHGNGNGINNGHVDLKEVKDIMKERQPVTNLNGATANGSADTVDPETKKSVLVPLGNGKTPVRSVKLIKTEKSEDGRLDQIVANGRRPDSGIVSQKEDAPTISESKRKVSDSGSNYSPSPNGNRATIEKIDEMLYKDAFSHLRSCGWYDEVYSVMRAKKKLCAQTDGNKTSEIELKNLLIEEARQSFKHKIPDSLKAHLIARIKSSHQ